MNTLSAEQITAIINDGVPSWVQEARDKSKKYNTLVNGKDVSDYLEKVTGLENKDRIKLRKQFAKSTKHLFGNLLRPVDRVFSAGGGARIYGKEDDSVGAELKMKLKDVSGGMSLQKWLKKVHFNKYITDPSGVIFMEWETKPEQKTYPTVKSIHEVRWYYSTGRDVESIVFEPTDSAKIQGVTYTGKEGSELEFVRVVDAESDRIYKRAKGDKEAVFTLIEDSVVENPFGQCPAITNSDLFSSCMSYRESEIHNVVELADEYLRSDSIKTIYNFLHGYPIFWFYADLRDICLACNGEGERRLANSDKSTTCTECNGEGRTYKKDVSEGIALTPPDDSDQPVITPNVAGYVTPPIEISKEMREQLQNLLNQISYTMWGTTYETLKNETATAKFIDAQPVNERLTDFTESFEDLERRITQLISKFHFEDRVEQITIIYGRRYLMEGSDSLLDSYLKMKKDGAAVSLLDLKLQQFYQTEYQYDPEMMIIMSKAMKVEPLIHNSLQEVKTLDEGQYQRKLAFGKWFKNQDNEYLLTKTVDEWEADLDQEVQKLNSN